MKVSKIIIAVLLVSALTIPLISCRSSVDPEAESEPQVVTVQRGDLVVDITATGNLLYSHQEELAFEIAGTVEEVLVEAGDSVEEGQVLARLDTSAWDEQVKVLEKQLATAKRQLTQAERQLDTKKRNVSAKEFALRQAQLDLQTAEYNVTVIADVKEAQDAVDKAEEEIRFAELKLKETSEPGAHPLAYQYWANEKRLAEARLAEAQQELIEILAGTSVNVTTDVAIEVEKKQLQVEQAQRQMEDARIAIEDARLDVEDARLDVEDARQTLEDAQQELAEAKATSISITAPLDGIITMVNVSPYGIVNKGQTVIVITDPTKFEAQVLVNEIDILQVREGVQASIEVDAMTGLSLPANVTSIAPTATIQAGVVNYKVYVELESLTPMEPTTITEQGEQPQANLEAFYKALDEAVKGGKLTRQQADGMKERWEQMPENLPQEQIDQFVERFKQMLERFPAEQLEQFMERFGQGAGGSSKRGFGTGQKPASLMLEALQLREGLSVTVSIIVQERTNVLLVSNQAIIPEGMNTYVEVMTDKGIERRQVLTGLSDWQYTEIIQGLSEGEQVVVPKGTTTTPTTPQQGAPGMFPGRGMFGK